MKHQEDDQGPPRSDIARLLNEDVIKHPADLKRLLRHFPDSFISRAVEIDTMRRKVNRPKSMKAGFYYVRPGSFGAEDYICMSIYDAVIVNLEEHEEIAVDENNHNRWRLR